MSLTEEQLELRKQGLGGSEIAAVAGLSRWSSPHQVWLEKTGRVPPKIQTAAMALGHRLEPLVADWWSAETGRSLVDPQNTFSHSEHPWALATPDRFIVKNGGEDGPVFVGLVEIKTAGPHTMHEWGSEEEGYRLPMAVLCQVAWQRFVLRIHEAEVAACLAGETMVRLVVPDTSDLEHLLFTVGEQFWHEHVLRDTPPPLDSSEGARRMVEELYPQPSRAELVIANGEADTLAATYLEARRLRESAEAAEQEAATKLKAMIGDAAGIQGRDWRATWKHVEGSVAWKAVAESLGATPGLAAAHRGAGYRRFMLKAWEPAGAGR